MGREQARESVPNVRLDVHLSDGGYQADVFVDGEEQYSQCRSFASSRPPSIEKSRWFNSIAALIERLRRPIGEDVDSSVADILSEMPRRDRVRAIANIHRVYCRHCGEKLPCFCRRRK